MVINIIFTCVWVNVPAWFTNFWTWLTRFLGWLQWGGWYCCRVVFWNVLGDIEQTWNIVNNFYIGEVVLSFLGFSSMQKILKYLLQSQQPIFTPVICSFLESEKVLKIQTSNSSSSGHFRLTAVWFAPGIGGSCTTSPSLKQTALSAMSRCPFSKIC